MRTALREGPIRYDLIDEETDTTVLHIYAEEETYSADWDTDLDIWEVREALDSLNLSDKEDMTANFLDEERQSENSLTASPSYTLSQDAYDWEDCTALTLDMGAFELSWTSGSGPANHSHLNSYDGTFQPLNKFYEKFPFAHHTEVEEDYAKFVESVTHSAHNTLREELNTNI